MRMSSRANSIAGGLARPNSVLWANFSELRSKGVVERGMSMAVQIDPNGRRAVEICAAFRIDQVGALATLNNNRFLLFPFLHLSKGMPEVDTIPSNEMGVHGRGVRSCDGSVLKHSDWLAIIAACKRLTGDKVGGSRTVAYSRRPSGNGAGLPWMQIEEGRANVAADFS